MNGEKTTLKSPISLKNKPKSKIELKIHFDHPFHKSEYIAKIITPTLSQWFSQQLIINKIIKSDKKENAKTTNLSTNSPRASQQQFATKRNALTLSSFMNPSLLSRMYNEEASTLRLFRIWSLIICDKRCTCSLKNRKSLVTLCSLFGNLGTDYGNILSIEGVKDCKAQLKYFPRK